MPTDQKTVARRRARITWMRGQLSAEMRKQAMLQQVELLNKSAQAAAAARAAASPSAEAAPEKSWAQWLGEYSPMPALTNDPVTGAFTSPWKKGQKDWKMGVWSSNLAQNKSEDVAEGAVRGAIGAAEDWMTNNPWKVGGIVGGLGLGALALGGAFNSPRPPQAPPVPSGAQPTYNQPRQRRGYFG